MLKWTYGFFILMWRFVLYRNRTCWGLFYNVLVDFKFDIVNLYQRNGGFELALVNIITDVANS